MKELKQQLILVLQAEDICEVERIIDTKAKPGPKYKSPKGQMPLVVSVMAVTNEIFEALHLSKADFIMTSIGMESENVFSQGEVSQSLFFGEPKKRQRTASIDYKVELNKALEREDYYEAAIIRDIIARVKTAKDLKKYRNRLVLRK